MIDDIVYREYAAQVTRLASVALTLLGWSGSASTLMKRLLASAAAAAAGTC